MEMFNEKSKEEGKRQFMMFWNKKLFWLRDALRVMRRTRVKISN